MADPMTLLTLGRGLWSRGLVGAASSSGVGGECGSSGVGGECTLSAVSAEEARGEEARGLRVCGGGDNVALGGKVLAATAAALVGEVRPALVGEVRPALVGEARPALGGEMRPEVEVRSALVGEVRPAPRRWRGVAEAGAASAGGCALAFPSIRLRRSVRRWASSALSSGTSSGNTNSTRALSAVATKRTSTH